MFNLISTILIPEHSNQQQKGDQLALAIVSQDVTPCVVIFLVTFDPFGLEAKKWLIKSVSYAAGGGLYGKCNKSVITRKCLGCSIT